MRTAFAGLGVALVLSMGSAPAWAADLTMRISLQLPLKSHLGQNLALFKEEVEKASDGSIEIEIYDEHLDAPITGDDPKANKKPRGFGWLQADMRTPLPSDVLAQRLESFNARLLSGWGALEDMYASECVPEGTEGLGLLAARGPEALRAHASKLQGEA